MSNKEFRVTEDMMATLWQRLGNYIIDIVFIFIFIILISFVIGILSVIIGTDAIIAHITTMNIVQQYLFGAIIIILYYGPAETFLARSFGKYITQTIVVLADGSKPDNATILKRTFCRLIPFDNFSFLFHSPPRGWHDSISGTYVVDKKILDEKMRAFRASETPKTDNQTNSFEP